LEALTEFCERPLSIWAIAPGPRCTVGEKRRAFRVRPVLLLFSYHLVDRSSFLVRTAPFQFRKFYFYSAPIPRCPQTALAISQPVAFHLPQPHTPSFPKGVQSLIRGFPSPVPYWISPVLSHEHHRLSPSEFVFGPRKTTYSVETPVESHFRWKHRSFGAAPTTTPSPPGFTYPFEALSFFPNPRNLDCSGVNDCPYSFFGSERPPE